jgi:hypothetical protein
MNEKSKRRIYKERGCSYAYFRHIKPYHCGFREEEAPTIAGSLEEEEDLEGPEYLEVVGKGHTGSEK